MPTKARKKPVAIGQNSTINAAEIAQFDGVAGGWWDASGPFRPLHRLNPVRLRYIRDAVLAHFHRKSGGFNVLQGLTVLDVGCGGGLLCEPLARMGAVVTGIDASGKAIAVARDHAAAGDLIIDYQQAETGDLLRGKKQFDLVCAMEVIEHVDHPEQFVAELAQLVKPGGMLLMSTLNRTPKSFLLGIVAAEYILRWIPRGTHQWQKFIRPSELAHLLAKHKMIQQDVSGLIFDPLRQEFRLDARDVAVNYLLWARREN